MSMGNVTDETIEEFGNKALTAKLEAEKKRDEAKSLDGQFRAVLKSAKDAGVDPDAVRWWIKARKQEPEDLDREIMWQNRMAKVMGLPIGTQLGVDFDTGETIASTVDKAQMRRAKGRGGAKRKANGKGEADPRAAYAMGVDAGRAGKSPKTAGKGLNGRGRRRISEGLAGRPARSLPRARPGRRAGELGGGRERAARPLRHDVPRHRCCL